MNTPRTDAERRMLKKAKSYPVDPVSAEFARRLETELAEAEKKIQHYERLNSDRCNMDRAMRHMQNELAGYRSQLAAMAALADRLATACLNLREGHPRARHTIREALAAYEAHKKGNAHNELYLLGLHSERSQSSVRRRTTDKQNPRSSSS